MRFDDSGEPAPDAEPLTSVADGATIVQCEVPDAILDGVYGADSRDIAPIIVRDGVLAAVVSTPTGAAWLRERLRNLGRLTWDGPRCAFTLPELGTVAGLLTWPDGEPVVDFPVRACRFGEFVLTDDEGRFEVEALIGTTCHPMAFVQEDSEAFGKSAVVTVEVDSAAPPEVVLVLPEVDAMWSLEQQHELSAQLAQMTERRLREHTEREARLLAARRDAPASEHEVLDALIAEERAWITWVEDELERFEDPAERAQAFRDAWMNQY